MATNFNILNQIAAEFDRRKPTIMRRLAVEAVNYSKRSFRRKGWDGENWPARAPGNEDPSRALLVKSGRMRNATRYQVSRDTAVLINDTEYASIHNRGGVLHPTVTKKMRGFAWMMHKKTGNDKWKGLALTKKTRLDIKIPQRKFLGKARELTTIHKGMIADEINLILKSHGRSL